MKPDASFSNLSAYELWAATYPPVPHNPLMRAEHEAMLELWPRTLDGCGGRALDLACGTGRFARVMQERGLRQVVAMDLSAGMLRRLETTERVRADMMRLPFAANTFDVVMSGLAVGHAPWLEAWMCEISRVLTTRGVLIYSDFHPDAADAGMTRSFTDENQQRHTLLHRRHALVDHLRAAHAAGLELQDQRELRVGIDIVEEFAGSEAFYGRWHGVPVVLAIRAGKRDR